MQILTAAYVLPISSQPIEQGAVAVEGDSIHAVGTVSALREKFPGAGIEDFGAAAILPGFVNCHSHLEITGMRGFLDSVEHDFTPWLLKLNGARSSMTDDEIKIAAVAGAMEGAQAGVTCFGDIGRFGEAGVDALKRVGLRGVVFQETEFSADNRTAEDDFKKLISKFEDLKKGSSGLVNVGLSPHSPYTVGSQLFELISQYSILNGVPITIHVAESADEVELLTQGTGFFTSVYEKYDVEWYSPHCTPVEYLERLGVLAARPLLAHCVQLSTSDIQKISASGSKIAHCPKSNAKFGHGYAPFEQFLDADIAVGLGSDSVASNNVCDILEESRFAAFAARNRVDKKRFVSAREVLETATLGGARAMGLDQKIGSLEPGKQADIAVVSVESLSQQPIHEVEAALVFSSNARDVAMTMVAGSVVYRAGERSNDLETEIRKELNSIRAKIS